MKRKRDNLRIVDMSWPGLTVDRGTLLPVRTPEGRGYPIELKMSDGSTISSFMPANLLPQLPPGVPELQMQRIYAQAISAWHIRRLVELVPAPAAAEWLAKRLIEAMDEANSTFASIPDHIERALDQDRLRRAIERGDIEPPEAFDDEDEDEEDSKS